MSMRIRRAPIVFFLAAAAVLFLYPVFMSALSSVRQNARIEGYEDLAGSLSGEERERALAEAFSYNQTIAEEQEVLPFRYRGAEATDAVYEKTLDNGGGMMGYLTIPAIGVRLPVMHGTGEDILNYAVGHMYGSSLPCGGSSAHAVLAAHTGLPEAELFNDLILLGEGDEFSVSILGEEHRYRVEAVCTVLPEEEAAYLQIEPGRDLITLYTCTPYGVNDHRLLVRGARIPDTASETPPMMQLEENSSAEHPAEQETIQNALPAAGMITFLLAALLVLLLFTLLNSLLIKTDSRRTSRNISSKDRRKNHANDKIPVCISHRGGHRGSGTHCRTSSRRCANRQRGCPRIRISGDRYSPY